MNIYGVRAVYWWGVSTAIAILGILLVIPTQQSAITMPTDTLQVRYPVYTVTILDTYVTVRGNSLLVNNKVYLPDASSPYEVHVSITTDTWRNITVDAYDNGRLLCFNPNVALRPAEELTIEFQKELPEGVTINEINTEIKGDVYIFSSYVKSGGTFYKISQFSCLEVMPPEIISAINTLSVVGEHLNDVAGRI